MENTARVLQFGEVPVENDRDDQSVVVDCRNLQSATSAEINVLIKIKKQLSADKPLRVVSENDALLDVSTIFQLSWAFQFYRTIEDAAHGVNRYEKNPQSGVS